jgi:tetratricopeptide (TPR) repeat protein
MTQGIPEKDRSITQAIEFMKKNRPLRTEEICRDYLLQNSGCTDHLRLLSNALMKQNRLPEAEERLRFALSLDAEFPQLHEDLGSVLALQSKFSEAIPEFERAIELQPALPLAHKKLGQALVAAGRGKDADEAFQVYIDSDEDRATIMKGVELLRTKQLDDAVAVFQSVLKRNPDSVNAMRYLAVCYWQGKTKLDDAEALLRRATQLAKDYLGAWLILGALL